jgi:metal-sulfur cluster biosynthetic enzyme
MAGALTIDPYIAEALRSVEHPEIGVNIVDLGLVYRGTRGPHGISIALTVRPNSARLAR